MEGDYNIQGTLVCQTTRGWYVPTGQQSKHLDLCLTNWELKLLGCLAGGYSQMAYIKKKKKKRIHCSGFWWLGVSTVVKTPPRFRERPVSDWGSYVESAIKMNHLSFLPPSHR